MEIRNNDNQPFEPRHFLTIYTNGNSYLMELGDFIKVDEKYKVGPSRPADAEFLNDLADSIKRENFSALQFSGLTPKNVWYHHSTNQEPTLIWVLPAGPRYLHFKEEVGASGMYNMPAMIFATEGGKLYVYRLDETGLEREDIKLYMLPLPNIYEDSMVCVGNNDLAKAKDLEGYIANMEALFFNTRFNALHHESFGEGIMYVDHLKKQDINLFPLVISKNETLKDLLDELT